MTTEFLFNSLSFRILLAINDSIFFESRVEELINTKNEDLSSLERSKKTFEEALEEISVGQISGPVGTYSNIPIELENLTCKILELKPAKISTQINEDYAMMDTSDGLADKMVRLNASQIRRVLDGWTTVESVAELKKRAASRKFTQKVSYSFCD